jgi:lantibiotic modifying enzyme
VDLLPIVRDALRWASDAGAPAGGGVSWPAGDSLYEGTAGVLLGLAAARLAGVEDFDAVGHRAAGRLRALIAEPPADPGLYVGYAGYGAALRCWSAATGDPGYAADAERAAATLAALPAGEWTDIIGGDAGVLLYLLAYDRPETKVVADRLLAAARPVGAGLEWLARADFEYVMPNFSHGGAGIGYALARAAEVTGRGELLDAAVAAANRVVELGAREDGTLLAPTAVPTRRPDFPVSYGWCHGPTGTVRLFSQLHLMQPDAGWQRWVAASRRAARDSGLPARKYPGFWDNVAQCCGTAGVGEMALDAYQETGDADWLGWADELAADVVSRAERDAAGTRWHNIEFREDEPELPAEPGWMQGAAGIAGWLARLHLVHRAGRAAPRLDLPDRPSLG